MLHRTAGFEFDFGIFTNIEPDHIGPNEHRDFQHYLECKSMLLRQCKVGIVNRDDKHFEQDVYKRQDEYSRSGSQFAKWAVDYHGGSTGWFTGICSRRQCVCGRSGDSMAAG